MLLEVPISPALSVMLITCILQLVEQRSILHLKLSEPGHVELPDIAGGAFEDPGQDLVAEICCGWLGGGQLTKFEFDNVVDLCLGVVLHVVGCQGIRCYYLIKLLYQRHQLSSIVNIL